jgi:hypothetical protein
MILQNAHVSLKGKLSMPDTSLELLTQRYLGLYNTTIVKFKEV